MNLQQLRFVRETVRHGFSLTRAAQGLRTSQPALSRGILELEAELGVDIFVRHGKRITGLTEPGKAIQQRAERALAEVGGIERVASDYRARDAGELRIATTHTQARYLLPTVIAEFRRRYPAVRLTLLQGSPKQISSQVISREADFAVATEVPEDIPELVLIPSIEWRHVVLVPDGHPLIGQPVTLERLAQYKIVTYVEAFAGRRRIDRAFEQAGIEPDIVLSAIDSDVIKTYVSLGLGIGIVAGMAYDPVRDRGLVALPAGHLFGVNRVRLAVHRAAYLRGFAIAFIELLAPDADRALIESLRSAGTA